MPPPRAPLSVLVNLYRFARNAVKESDALQLSRPSGQEHPRQSCQVPQQPRPAVPGPARLMAAAPPPAASPLSGEGEGTLPRRTGQRVLEGA